MFGTVCQWDRKVLRIGLRSVRAHGTQRWSKRYVPCACARCVVTD